MEHYKILHPHGKSNEYYNGHHVCLWQVTESEIVGHWEWDDLVAHGDWYQAIVMPAFWQYRRERATLAPRHDSSILSAVRDQLSRRLLICCSIFELHDSVTNDPPDPASLIDEDIKTSSEGPDCWSEDEPGWDTDEEAGEAIGVDDMIKVIEGDW